MKAIYFEKGGTTDVLQYGEVDEPAQCGETQVKIKLKAAGINPVDSKIRAAPDRFPVTFPVIPGCDGAGIVAAVGSAVRQFKTGDEVYFSQPGFNFRQGTYAEYTCVDESLLASKPRSLDFAHAAAAPLVLITAWEALHDRTRLASGQTVLIHAGAGGVGHVAIQLAKLAGAKVITTVSSDEKATFVKHLGADKIINYKTHDVANEVMRWTSGEGVDIAFDTVGPPVLQNCVKCVKNYGDIVTILQPPADMNWSESRLRNIRFSFELMLTPVILDLGEAKQHQGEILRRCAALIDEGRLKIEVSRLFDLNDAAVAQRYLEEQHPAGKLVLKVEE
jgi:NADPH:quinone reductase